MVYVDDLYKYSIGKYGRMKMSHLVADTSEELFEMVDKIGLDRKHIQFQGEWKEHFDVSMKFRAKAVKAGAKEISWRESTKIILAKKKNKND